MTEQEIAADAALVQGSDEWREAIRGSLGGSRIGDALAKLKKGGWAASHDDVRYSLVAEILTKKSTFKFVSKAMEHGTEFESMARDAYAFYSGQDVQTIGIVRHPTIVGSHCSPDGLVGTDGGIEIKAPTSPTHVETLETGAIDEKYLMQCKWFLACTGRKWVDYCSFDPDMPEDLRLFVKRVVRNDAEIKQIEADAMAFIAEVNATIAKLPALAEEYHRAVNALRSAA